jgi:hypothetical protein
MEPTTAIITLVIIIISLFWVIIFQKKELNHKEELIQELQKYETQTTGLWATDKIPGSLLFDSIVADKIVDSKSILSEEFKHYDDAWRTYCSTVFFQLGDTKKEFKNDTLPDYKQAPKPPRGKEVQSHIKFALHFDDGDLFRFEFGRLIRGWRSHQLEIDIKDNFDLLKLYKLIDYLKDLSCTLTPPKDRIEHPM